MCTREELKTLLYELILRVDQVAFLSAKYQLNDEFYNSTGNTKIPYNDYVKARFEKVLRFQRAYLRYFVFAADPLANFIVPLRSSSLSLFITNIVADVFPNETVNGYHTTNSIIYFLRVNQLNASRTFLPCESYNLNIFFFFFIFISLPIRIWCNVYSYFIRMIWKI